MEIISLAKDGRYRTLYEDRQLYMFLPVSQHPRARMTLLVSAQSAEALRGVVESARREIAHLDARLPVVCVMMAEKNLAIAYLGPGCVGELPGLPSFKGRVHAVSLNYDLCALRPVARTRLTGNPAASMLLIFAGEMLRRAPLLFLFVSLRQGGTAHIAFFSPVPLCRKDTLLPKSLHNSPLFRLFAS